MKVEIAPNTTTKTTGVKRRKIDVQIEELAVQGKSKFGSTEIIGAREWLDFVVEKTKLSESTAGNRTKEMRDKNLIYWNEGRGNKSFYSFSDGVKLKVDLLTIIGQTKTTLVEELFTLVGATNMPDLTELARLVTASNSDELKALVNAVGIGNISQLNSSKLVEATGTAHIPLLAEMITNVGGVTNLVELRDVIKYKHDGDGSKAEDLTKEANGNAALFTRLATEVPQFLETAPPGALQANVTQAKNDYNAAVLHFNTNDLLTTFISELTDLRDHAQDAYNEAVAVGGVNAGLLTNVQNRINGVTAKITLLSAGGLSNVMTEINAAKVPANTLRGILNPLNNFVTNNAGGYSLGSFNTAITGANAANINLQGLEEVPSIHSINFDHFLVRHTAHYFDFGDIKTDNTQWETSWGASSNANVSTQFAAVLDDLATNQDWLAAGVQKPNMGVPAGGSAQIAGRNSPVANQIIVGQFFPHNNPGAGYYPHSGSTMLAIKKLL